MRFVFHYLYPRDLYVGYKNEKKKQKNNNICIVLWVKWFLKECYIKVYIFNYIYNFYTFGFIVSIVLFQTHVLLCQNIYGV